MNWTTREKKILKLIKTNLKSPSHGLDHLTNVAEFGKLLAEKYSANRELVTAAALLHDLGRNNPKLHGKDSSEYSAKLALPILHKAGYSQKETALVLQIIREHDQPFFSSKLPESRILKDSDFLDGFGFRGLLRSIFFTAEAGQPLVKALERVGKIMPERFAGLEFTESKNLAKEQFYLTRLLLDKSAQLAKEKVYRGRLIVFEGISGTGKETQANLLSDYLQKKGQQTEIYYHPTLRMKEVLKLWRKNFNESFSEVYFFLADRYASVKNQILPALKEGKTVICLRNYISSLVYQAQNPHQELLIHFLYSSFEPLPDLIYYFDINPKAALKRIEHRSKKTGEAKGKFEKFNLLNEKKQRYERVISGFKNVIRIDADRSIDAIHSNIVDSLLTLWQKKGI